MDVVDAASLIAPAVGPPAPCLGDVAVRWADLGAGRGTFTRALARLLGAQGWIAAVDRDPHAAAALARLPESRAGPPGVEPAPAVPAHTAAPRRLTLDEGERAYGGAAARGRAQVSAHRADLADPHALDGVLAALGWRALDGVLLANALHFVPAAAQPSVLGALVDRVQPGGRLVVVEYEGRRPSPWMPAPVAFERLRELAATVPGLAGPVWVGERPSTFGGAMYAAHLERRS